jgi:hypothetical protein
MRVSVMLPAPDMWGLYQAADVLVCLGRQLHGSRPKSITDTLIETHPLMGRNQ